MAQKLEDAGTTTSRVDELANLPFTQNRPTGENAQRLRDELLFERATQIYLWALPLINTLGMKYGSEQVFGAGYRPTEAAINKSWKPEDIERVHF